MSALIERDREPSAGELRWFGALLLAFLGAIGALVRWRTGTLAVPVALWAAAAVLAVAYYAVPAIRRTVFRAWMAVTYPLGWLVSHVLLAIFYFAVLTPIGWVMRLAGRDPMQRRLERDRPSYWLERAPTQGAERYWRQF
ncbi:MAG TPA: SxtJ family membrane protein [Candidatus Binatia bacterium]|nr:SxtJ family membrane protein [Candidatus Binatia bacterium]